MAEVGLDGEDAVCAMTDSLVQFGLTERWVNTGSESMVFGIEYTQITIVWSLIPFAFIEETI